MESNSGKNTENNGSVINTISNTTLIVGGTVLAISAVPIVIGFGTVGDGAGTIAAGIQSGLGAVSGGGLFAGVTSLAMKGYFVGGAISGAVATGVGATMKYFSGSESDQAGKK